MEKQVIESRVLGEKCIKKVLDNGLTVLVLEKKDFSSAYAIFGTRFGSIDSVFSLDGERVSLPDGIAHFLEHKMFENEEGDAFTLYSKTGASANAYTSFDRTCYLFSCSGNFYKNLEILLGFVGAPYFTEQTIEKEQGIIGQEIKMYDDDPSWRVLFNLLGAMYKSHSVKIDIAGTAETIARINEKLLYDCHRAFYNPHNMCLAVAGNVDAEKIFKMAEEMVKPVSAKVERIYNQEPAGVKTDYVEQKLQVSIPLFTVGIKEDIGDIVPSVKTAALSEAAAQYLFGKASPLYERLLGEGLITPSFSKEYFYGRGYSAYIVSGESENPKKVAEEIKSYIAEVQQKGVDKALAENSLKKLYGGSVASYNSMDNIANSLMEGFVLGFDPFEKEEEIKKITVQELDSRIKEINLENLALSVVFGE